MLFKLQIRDYEQQEDFAVSIQVVLEQNENAVVIINDEAHTTSIRVMNK